MSVSITSFIFNETGMQITGQSFLDGKLINFTVDKTINGNPPKIKRGLEVEFSRYF